MAAAENTLAILREQLQRNRESLAGLHGNSPVMLALRDSFSWNERRLIREIEIAEAEQDNSCAKFSKG